MEEITVLDTRLVSLANMCDNYYNYENIVYELHPLLTEVLGQTNVLFRNFDGITKSRIDTYTKCQQLKATINAFRTIIALKSKERRFQIFVSSTFIDLEAYRKTISDEIIFRGHIPAGMEDFTACGEDLETYIKRVIDQSDYYVLILGQRWGSALPSNENKSYTMMEYEYAKSKNMRIIPMIYNGDATLAGNDLEVNGKKFEKFKQEISKLVPQYFKDENELIRKLTKALEKEIKNHPQKGWIRL